VKHKITYFDKCSCSYSEGQWGAKRSFTFFKISYFVLSWKNEIRQCRHFEHEAHAVGMHSCQSLEINTGQSIEKNLNIHKMNF